jgi:alkylhydroperoxidase/carboxymuconolactone decarboxylase family protein YurZ
MDKERQEIRDMVAAAGRGPFTGWWAQLLEFSPQSLLHIHRVLEVGEQDGPISPMMRHLIWVVADLALMHLYPRGAGIHVRIALEEGATFRQVIQAFEIATVVSIRGQRVGLPVILEAASEAGQPVATRRIDADLRARITERCGHWAEWMEAIGSVSPKALTALVDLAPDADDAEGLDARSRELLYFAAYSCPAVMDVEGMRIHARQALAAGATPQELIQVLRLADCIGVHSIAEGILSSSEHLSAHSK